jgi:hypothetical protein
MTIRIGPFALATALALLSIAGANAVEPLVIAKQGYLFAGGKYTTVNGAQAAKSMSSTRSRVAAHNPTRS